MFFKMKKFLLSIIFFILAFLISFGATVRAEEPLKVEGVHFDNSDRLIFISAQIKVIQKEVLKRIL